MAKECMQDHIFEQLLTKVNQETKSTNRKIHILFESRGFFSAQQASRMIYAFGIPSDKIRAIQILEPRLARMTCSEARDVLGAFSIHNDKLRALECIKRALVDCQTREGVEAILAAFAYETDKMRALGILTTVRSDVADKLAAGGHQGYAALGGLYTQCRPLELHLYGSLEEQKKHTAGSGTIDIPVQAKTGVLPSMYTGHPSYAYPNGRDYAEDRGYPGNTAFGEGSFFPSAKGECPAKDPVPTYYPAGAPLMGQHQYAPAPTGYQGIASGKYDLVKY